MRLTRTKFWALGLLLIFFVLSVDRIVFILRAERTDATIINIKPVRQRLSLLRSEITFRFMHKGHVYASSVSHYTERPGGKTLPVLFNPGDPSSCLENSFAGLWMWKCIFFIIAFAIWSAAVTSFISEKENIVISGTKIRLEKIVSTEDY